MNCEAWRAMKSVRGKTSSSVSVAMKRRKKRCSNVNGMRSSCRAAAEPVRDFSIEKTVTKLSVMTATPNAPTSIKNSLFLCGRISEPMTAACPEPMPGRNEQKGAERSAALPARSISFFEGMTFLSESFCCAGSCSLLALAVSSAERPKSPVKRGMRGSLTGRWNVSKPRRPESRKMLPAMRGCVSRQTRYAEIAIRR